MFRIKLGCSLDHSAVLIRLAHQCASADAGGVHGGAECRQALSVVFLLCVCRLGLLVVPDFLRVRRRGGESSVGGP